MDEGEINMMGKGGLSQCRRCGGYGHFARECGTPMEKGDWSKGKGKGKGEVGKGFGQGFVKGHWEGHKGSKGESKGFGKGGDKGKGKGKGYQGTCWVCGKIGHKAWECPGKGVSEVSLGEKEVSSVELGGVWMLGCVDKKDEGFVEVKGRRANRFRKKGKEAVCFGGGAKFFVSPEVKEEVELCAVESEGRKTKVTVDSAAEESACPPAWGEEFGLMEVEPGKEMKLVNASGGRIPHWGSREVQFRAEDVAQVQKLMSLGFQVCDVKKPLAAVWRICEKGNIVQFGPEAEDCFIKNKRSGDKVLMRREGGSYVLDIEFDGVF